ncbi:MAG: hypothetical protein KBG48_09745 [Kofleriaceae bacterium]|nr:hypothetical protein [Kofleriaceae bacterium]MBP9167660.1 hypothetical protein [Kofleriaceae bacterium]MBP9861997.1 hypothetical protein [Kofleriaceae bacterium]
MSRPHLLAALTAIVAALAAAPARADDCARTERKVKSIMRTIDTAGTKAVELWSRCLFHGPDPKAVAKLTAITKGAFAALTGLPDPAPACVKAGDFGRAVGTLGNSAGQRFGLAWSTCSPQAQARVAQLAAAGKPVEEIEAELGKMAEAWIGAIAP